MRSFRPSLGRNDHIVYVVYRFHAGPNHAACGHLVKDGEKAEQRLDTQGDHGQQQELGQVALLSPPPSGLLARASYLQQ
jgi:hypothetical protein